MKYVIVGGVAGGATAAARIRRNDESAEIVLFEKGEYISYANCGLPYYIGEVIKERDNLFLQTPESFGTRFNMSVRVNNEVLSIDREGKTVEVKDLKTGKTYTESYDKLLLSPGATPVVPPIEGISSRGVFTLRNVEDTDKIKSYIDNNEIKNAVIVGAGFIGLEMAENLHHRGINVSIVEMAPQVMTPIDFSMASFVHAHIRQQGVDLFLEKALNKISDNGSHLSLSLNTGETLCADLVILSIGVRPNTYLAEKAGLSIGQARGIAVNEYLQTSDENIYAVGDAIEFPHPITKKPWTNYLAGPANRQARIVADNMSLSANKTYEGSIGTSIAKVFDLTVATTGLPAKALQRENIGYKSVTLHPNSHAGYYPAALPMTLKITFCPETGRLYGAQAIGVEGIDKRIDSIAQLIKQNGTIEDLMETEHCYAPPYSSAKDPVALAGYIAENIVRGKVKPVYWREVRDADRSKVCIIDTRTAHEHSLGKIEGAMNIPVDEMRNRLNEIPTDRPIYLYCAVGLRGYLSSNILSQNGFKEVYNLVGGYRLYSTATADYNSSKQAVCTDSENNGNGNNEQTANEMNNHKVIQVDACGLSCPGPIIKLKQGIDSIQEGEVLELCATDPGFLRDAEAWSQTTGNKLLGTETKAGRYIARIQKSAACGTSECVTSRTTGNGKTLILFSDDLDKTLATFVLANGAVATGEKVSIFFTFWGLNAIKKQNPPKTEGKDIWARMFGMMLPKDSRSLSLSKMNMFGMGSKMMRMIMRKRGVESLEELRQQAIDNGVEFIACQMSMDVMGISKEELLDNVTIGGVATYMNRAEKSSVNLFI